MMRQLTVCIGKAKWVAALTFLLSTEVYVSFAVFVQDHATSLILSSGNKICCDTWNATNSVDKRQFGPIWFLGNNPKRPTIAVNKRYHRSVFHVRWNYQQKHVVNSSESPALNSSKPSWHPRQKISKNRKLQINPKLYFCHDKYSVLCINKSGAYKRKIIHLLQKSMTEISNETNFYNVELQPLQSIRFEAQYYSSTCMVMEAGVKVLKRKDVPSNVLEFRKHIPRQQLFRNKADIKTCAIVSSASSLAGSALGKFIDSHDVVMRFNNAPVKGYEMDVGAKTTIRVVNSQIVTKPEFNFTNADIFQNVSIAAWDPGRYNGTLRDWLSTADFNLFSNYEKYRKRYPKSRAFLIDPKSIWRLWQVLQMFAGHNKIQRNPPSSGFIGLALLLPYCPTVHFIEYIPSTRLSGRCHYYSHEMNSACTFGAWHPLAAEKLMALDMNVANDITVFQAGFLRIRRPDKLLCGLSVLGH